MCVYLFGPYRYSLLGTYLFHLDRQNFLGMSHRFLLNVLQLDNTVFHHYFDKCSDIALVYLMPLLLYKPYRYVFQNRQLPLQNVDLNILYPNTLLVQ